MRADQDKFETHHLTCPVCGALPDTTCIDTDYRELGEVHQSRRMTIAERNWRSRQGGGRRSWWSSAASGGLPRLLCLTRGA